MVLKATISVADISSMLSLPKLFKDDTSLVFID
jgi:hypothetical protein